MCENEKTKVKRWKEMIIEKILCVNMRKRKVRTIVVKAVVAARVAVAVMIVIVLLV